MASPNAANPGPHEMPMEAAIGQLLSPYRPGGHQGNNQQNDNQIIHHFAGRFDGHRDMAVGYCAHRPITKSHWMPASGKHSLK
jgi:hypothetical protein